MDISRLYWIEHQVRVKNKYCSLYPKGWKFPHKKTELEDFGAPWSAKDWASGGVSEDHDDGTITVVFLGFCERYGYTSEVGKSRNISLKFCSYWTTILTIEGVASGRGQQA